MSITKQTDGLYWDISTNYVSSIYKASNADFHIQSSNNLFVDAPLIIKGKKYLDYNNYFTYLNTRQQKLNHRDNLSGGEGRTYLFINYKYSELLDYNNASYDYNSDGVVYSRVYNDGPNANYSLITWYRIMCAGEIDIYSDKRIKQNICKMPKDFGLNTIRKLVPCTYNYKDVVNKGTRTKYGFIAQEVDEILPSVVKKVPDFIPNIYELANISGNRITLTNFSTKDLLTQETNLKMKLVNHEDKEFIVTLKEIIDDKTFSIQESILEVLDNKIFVYGQQVEDMHSLEKNAIFSITTAAVKDFDIELQETKTIVEKQEEEIDNLKNELKNLKDFIINHHKTEISL